MYVIENNRLEPVDQEIPGKFCIRGHFENDRFVSSGHLMGNAPLATEATEGRPGWFELSTQKFYSQQTAQAPVSPYIIGYMTHSGFVPSRREIY